MLALRASSNLRPIPPVATTNRVQIASPADFADWDDLLTTHPPTPGFEYQFAQGDYLSAWGQGLITNAYGGGGTAAAPVVIRYTGNSDELHPVKRTGGGAEAIIDGLKFNGSNQGHWLVVGMTNRAPAFDTDVIGGPGGICFDRCLFESPGVARHYGIRLRSGNDNVVQRCVVRGYINAAGDLGINVVPDNGAMSRTKIIDNEVYDCGDSFQVSQNALDETVATDGLVEGNDFYFTAAYRNADGTGDMENAMDFKAGNALVPWIVRRNRCWGSRTNLVSATGDLIVVHVAAQNIQFLENIFGDAPCAFIEVVTGAGARNLVIARNLFHDIQRYYPEEHAGAALRLVNNAAVYHNVFARCGSVLYVPGALEQGGPLLKKNMRVETDANHADTASSTYLDSLNHRATVDSFAGYQRKRWTGIEVAEGALPNLHVGRGRDRARRGGVACRRVGGI